MYAGFLCARKGHETNLICRSYFLLFSVSSAAGDFVIGLDMLLMLLLLLFVC